MRADCIVQGEGDLSDKRYQYFLSGAKQTIMGKMNGLFNTYFAFKFSAKEVAIYT